MKQSSGAIEGGRPKAVEHVASSITVAAHARRRLSFSVGLYSSEKEGRCTPWRCPSLIACPTKVQHRFGWQVDKR